MQREPNYGDTSIIKHFANVSLLSPLCCKAAAGAARGPEEPSHTLQGLSRLCAWPPGEQSPNRGGSKRQRGGSFTPAGATEAGQVPVHRDGPDRAGVV